MGFKKTARTTKEFPTVATIEISVEQTAVENDKYIGTVVLPQEYLPRKDIFSTSSSGFVAPTRIKRGFGNTYMSKNKDSTIRIEPSVLYSFRLNVLNL